MRPDEFLRSYRTWLLQFNDLRDMGFRGLDHTPVRAYTNIELEEFRNQPKLPWVERDSGRRLYRVYRPGVLPYRSLHAHHIERNDQTLWMTNGQKHQQLLML